MRLDAAFELADERSDEILAVSEALESLAEESPIKADLVKLRYFAGMSHQEAADALGISLRNRRPLLVLCEGILVRGAGSR